MYRVKLVLELRLLWLVSDILPFVHEPITLTLMTATAILAKMLDVIFFSGSNFQADIMF
jgi:hypothetical protein